MIKKLLPVVLCISAVFTQPGFAEKNQLNADYSINQTGITVTAESAENDNLSIIILNPGYDFKADENAEDAVAYFNGVHSVNAEEKYSFPFTPQSGYGEYKIKVTAYNNDNVNIWEKSYYNIDPSLVLQCVTEMKTVTAESFDERLEYYVSEHIIYTAKVPETESYSLGEYFVLAREMYKLGLIENETKEFEDIQDIEECLKCAAVMMSVMTDTLADEICGRYAMIMKKIFQYDDLNYGILADLYETEETEAEKIANELKYYALLAKLSGASYAEIEQVITENAEFLNIDTDYITQSGVSMAEISKYIGTAYSKGQNVDFDTKIKEIITEIKNKNQSTGTGGGSSGGGKKSSGTVAAMITPPKEYVPKEEKKQSFSDLSGYDWAKDAIEKLYEKGIINGSGDGNFSPERFILREEAVKIITGAFEIYPEGHSDFEFADCKPSDWYYPYIRAAYESGIVTGISEDIFGTGCNISRQDLAVLIDRIIKRNGKNINAGNMAEFSDKDEISSYALQAVRNLSEAGIITGYNDGSIKPKNTVTRAEAAVIVQRTVDYIRR